MDSQRLSVGRGVLLALRFGHIAVVGRNRHVSPVIHFVMTSVSIRDLRNHGGEIIDRVEHGEAVRVTRDGRPVAELRPLDAQRLTLPAILERFRSLPAMDPVALREDIDSIIDTSL